MKEVFNVLLELWDPRRYKDTNKTIKRNKIRFSLVVTLWLLTLGRRRTIHKLLTACDKHLATSQKLNELVSVCNLFTLVIQLVNNTDYSSKKAPPSSVDVKKLFQTLASRERYLGVVGVISENVVLSNHVNENLTLLRPIYLKAEGSYQYLISEHYKVKVDLPYETLKENLTIQEIEARVNIAYGVE